MSLGSPANKSPSQIGESAVLFKAHMEGGKIVLDDPVAIADGTQLLVHVVPSSEQIKRSRERLMKFAGVDRSPETDASTTFEKELYDPNE